jgi:hypothetical protein
MKKPESLLRAKVLKYLKLSRPECFWISIPGTAFMSGMPDIHGLSYGKPIYIELKIEDNKLSKLQEFIKFKIEKAEGIYLVIRSIDELVVELQRVGV